MATTELRIREEQRSHRSPVLPRWPFTAMLALYPIWWVLGLGSMALIPFALCMLVLLVRRGGIRLPRGAGIWLLFLLLMCASIIGIDSGGRALGFVYRALLYFSVTIVFVYIYNAREQLTTRYVLGVVTLFWVYTVIGGFAGVLFPTFSFRTPMSFVLPGSLRGNEVIDEMVVRSLTQYKPDGWLDLEPRPSAPFLYTNQWGNVYSLTLPMVLAYMAEIRRGVRFTLLAVGVLVSLIPAFLTLNRGMFIGLAVAAVYMLVRFVLSGQLLRAMWILGAGAIVGIVALLLDVGSRLADRVETSGSTDTRSMLYEETWRRTLQSPLFGYGSPRPSNVAEPSVGTQGHLWTVMFSYGLPALLCFVLVLVGLVIATARVSGTAGLLLHTVQLVILVEMLYYGVLPNGLILSFAAAALVMRDRQNSCGST